MTDQRNTKLSIQLDRIERKLDNVIDKQSEHASRLATLETLEAGISKNNEVFWRQHWPVVITNQEAIISIQKELVSAFNVINQVKSITESHANIILEIGKRPNYESRIALLEAYVDQLRFNWAKVVGAIVIISSIIAFLGPKLFSVLFS